MKASKETKKKAHSRPNPAEPNAVIRREQDLARMTRYLPDPPESFKKLVAAFPLITYPAEGPSSAPPKRPMLWIYGPGLSGSPASFDVECLKHQAWLRFNDVDFAVKNVDSAYCAPSERLPTLHLTDGTLLEPFDIPSWIAKQLKGKSSQAEGEEDPAREKIREEARAWTTSLETKLHAALLLTLYHSPLFQLYTVPLYNPALSPLASPSTPFLASLLHRLVSHSDHRQATSQIRSLTSTPKRRALDGDQIIADAVEILKALETRAAESAGAGGWILGSDEPTSLDAALLAYLRVVRTLPEFPDRHTGKNHKCELRQEVDKLHKLVRWEKAVFAKYFAKA